ncbi:MAG: hypothetical protein Q7K33_02830 [Candidatus Berkelbacteria bacterium]|nr:hypothetical protein [Candidatus Berkelbacteria bacterium]
MQEISPQIEAQLLLSQLKSELGVAIETGCFSSHVYYAIGPDGLRYVLLGFGTPECPWKLVSRGMTLDEFEVRYINTPFRYRRSWGQDLQDQYWKYFPEVLQLKGLPARRA